MNNIQRNKKINDFKSDIFNLFEKYNITKINYGSDAIEIFDDIGYFTTIEEDELHTMLYNKIRKEDIQLKIGDRVLLNNLIVNVGTIYTVVAMENNFFVARYIENGKEFTKPFEYRFIKKISE